MTRILRWIAVKLATMCMTFAILAPPARATDIVGAGATFPYPIYVRWAEAYQKETGTSLLYQAIGSGGGIRRIKARAVTFGASDIPLTPEELANDGLIQFPMVLGGVVPVLGRAIAARGKIVLSGPLLADIFMGRITRWDDSRIKQINPRTSLPAIDIVPVHRADQSGTTFLFANYLTKEGAEFGQNLREDAALHWPTGMDAKGNEGISEAIEEIPGTIGYVEFAYAKAHGLAQVSLVNRAGSPVEPGKAGLKAGAENIDWAHAKDFDLTLTDAPGKASWPITGLSFILIPKKPADPAAAREALQFFDWVYRKGDPIAAEFDYVGMPANVVTLARRAWHEDIGSPAGSIWR